MKLQPTQFRKFNFRDARTKEYWSIWAMSVGSPGRRYRQELVPISFGDIPQDRVGETAAWEVVPSRSGRPKIVWSGKETSGIICKLTSNNGFGRAVGEVLINKFALENVTVLAHGVGGIDTTGELWNEYVVTIDDGAWFLLQATRPPDIITVWEEVSGFRSHGPVLEEDYQHYINLSDPQVKRWIRSERTRNGK